MSTEVRLPPVVASALAHVLGLAARWRRLISVVLHAVLVAASSYLAFWLRFDGPTPPEQAQLWLGLLPLLLIVRGLTFAGLRLYEGLWRYTSIWDLQQIISGVLGSTLLFFVISHVMLGITLYPRSVFIIDSILLICLMGGLRLTRRIVRELSAPRGGTRVLVIGAGDAGELIVRDIRNNSSYGYEPVGFVDDDESKVGQRIHGVPVLGTRQQLAEIIAQSKPHEVLIAMPRVEHSVLRSVVRSLEPFKIPITTLPSLRDLLDGTVGVSQIRRLAVEDLLARAPVGLDPKPVRRLIEGRVVMVTGAGGSIGSELCRQIAACQPSGLVLFERYENSLYAIATELHDAKESSSVAMHSVIGDVTDASRVEACLAEYQPALVFHAAAHKHVPLMEANPSECVKNNVRGTRILVEAAERHGVDRFILISTDKAVNPTSVMGATKRAAELIVKARAAESSTAFVTVRFGNVLGSNGSVVPRFVEQIRAGGPVTVTHPDIRRYFMLIPEAVQLVLHAAARGDAGVTYALDMGEQVKIIDLARDLIRLSGLVPEDDISIVFTGLRPGEKLHEELVAQDEMAQPSETEKILRIHSRGRLRDDLAANIARLEEQAIAGHDQDVLGLLRVVVPELTHPDIAVQSTTAGGPLPEFTRGVRPCPGCGSFNFHRSRARNPLERVRKVFTELRMHRCHQCGWRGWVQLLDDTAAATDGAKSSAQLDLSSIDAAVPLPPETESTDPVLR